MMYAISCCLFKVIEQVDEPRAEKGVSFQKTLFDLDSRDFRFLASCMKDRCCT